MSIVTPAMVEAKLVALSKQYDIAHAALEDAEHGYATAKADYEIGVAGSRLSFEGKATVQEREDTALVACAIEYRALVISEATVKAARANAQRLRTQIDVTRSVGTIMRASLDMG